MGTEVDSSSFPSSSSSSTAQRKYDVFLSFRGEDTCNNFVDHLFNALKGKGIHTFRENEELKKGKAIVPKFLEAIKESKFAIIILSKEYASSTWCLDELAHIVFCKEEKGMTVLPVFHYVNSFDV
ncbi:disease resistance protein Roq1-like [Quercus robur]|uniref:disease resistance protein Roq1-like n=1 Tax=Quercus robur TaxID=38942 RepID=UPI002163B571|nr:disease resistance protein Roq1-like [Quercus robur]